MVFLEAVFIFPRWDYRLFHGAVGNRVLYGSIVLRFCVFDDCVYNCEEIDIRRPHVGMAVFGMHHTALQRRAVVLPWNSRAIFVQNLYGSEKKADLPRERGTVKRQGRFAGGRPAAVTSAGTKVWEDLRKITGHRKEHGYKDGQACQHSGAGVQCREIYRRYGGNRT